MTDRDYFSYDIHYNEKLIIYSICMHCDFSYYQYFYMIINKTFLLLLGLYFFWSEVDSKFKLLLFSHQIIETCPLLHCAVPGPVFSN